MQHNFTWNEVSEKAAGLLAQGVPDLEVAKTVGVNRTTLFRWKKNPEFSARVASVTSVARETVQDQAISNVQARVAAANARWEIIQRRSLIQLEGSLFLDMGMVREGRELEEHAARMLGQLSTKHEHSGPGKGPIPVIVIPSIIPLNEAEVQEMALPAPKKRS